MNIDFTNTFLILLSFVLACVFPIELFVIVYALLGPLHYLTEINWIKDQNFFVSSKKYVWFLLGVLLAITFCVPYILGLSIFTPFFSDVEQQHLQLNILKNYINWTLFMGLIAALAFTLFKSNIQKAFLLGFGALIAFLLNANFQYNLLFGVFLPTIIHVYIFTFLFMLYGILKKDTPFGILNLILLVLIPLFLWAIKIDDYSYFFPSSFKEIFIENKFHYLNAFLIRFLKIRKEFSFFFYEKVDLKIQIFIAFAYTYHYLNWFSKTAIIGWHKKLSAQKSIVILLLWVTIVILFIYDYKLGFTVSLIFSILHVILEFPLNIISLKSIITKCSIFLGVTTQNKMD